MIKQPLIIAPSILSANLAELGQDVQKVLLAGADWVHLDVMDQHYVPNLTFGPGICAALRAYGIEAPIDVHLMAQPVDDLITQFAKAGATLISFHPEASSHVDRSLSLIHDLGCQAGLVLNPATPPEVLDYVWDKLDLILVMSVNPGFGGQKFIPSVIPKIKKLRELIDARGRSIRLSVDGGINAQTIHSVTSVGADTVVAGSAIFGSKDYQKTIEELRKNA